jgi:hypothetical protein
MEQHTGHPQFKGERQMIRSVRARNLPWFLLLLIVAIVLVDGFAKKHSSDRQVVSANTLNYLSLAQGERWLLRSPQISTPIVLQVTQVDRGAYTLSFENPWINSVLTLRADGERIVLTALTMNGQTAPLSDSPVYWDFAAAEGAHWKNSIGTITVVSRDKTVKAAKNTYEHCIEFREVNKQGKQEIWIFAPGVGFVQFGEGDWAFVLDATGSALDVPAAPAAAPVHSTGATGDGQNSLLLGLSANPFAGEPYTPASVRARLEQSLTAGVNYLYLSPKWNELEPKPGNYNFKDLDFQVDQLDTYKLTGVLNLRIIDTNRRTMPPDLMNRSLHDPEVRRRLVQLIQAVMPRLHHRVHYLLIGNEIDGYFNGHQDEIQDFAGLWQAGADAARTLEPGLQVSSTITFDAVSKIDTAFRPILERTDFLSVTYYPLSPDFKVRDPKSVVPELDGLVRSARGKKILLQEVGCPTSPLNDSSEDKQAQVFSAVLDELAGHRHDFLGANFFLMSDLSDKVVNPLAAYYSLANAAQFKSFLQTLGMFDADGRPKKSWGMFQGKAKLVSRPSL